MIVNLYFCVVKQMLPKIQAGSSFSYTFALSDIVTAIFLLLTYLGSSLVLDSAYKLIEYISSHSTGLMHPTKMPLGLLFYKSVGWGDDSLRQ